jgi:hypothetical protein
VDLLVGDASKARRVLGWEPTVTFEELMIMMVDDRRASGSQNRSGEAKRSRHTKIRFGTDGWRGVIAEDYTFDNVRRCAQGYARYLLDQGKAGWRGSWSWVRQALRRANTSPPPWPRCWPPTASASG